MVKRNKLKKSYKFIIIGFVLILLGGIFLINSLKTTGFVIGKNNYKVIYSIPSLILIILGILIASSGDSLQDWLGRKEKEKRKILKSLRELIMN